MSAPGTAIFLGKFDADDDVLSLTVKSDNKDKLEKTDIMSGKTDKFDAFGKKEEQQKKDAGPDQNQKSEKILKDEDKMEKNNKANEKAEKVDKPEKTDKDEKKSAEKKEEKGGKGTAKSPTGNGGKPLPSPDGKTKVGHARRLGLLLSAHISCIQIHTQSGCRSSAVSQRSQL